jgi:hypothetical protein
LSLTIQFTGSLKRPTSYLENLEHFNKKEIAEGGRGLLGMMMKTEKLDAF